MPRVKQSQLARSRLGNEMSQSVAARMTRNRMRADWETVRAMLLNLSLRPSRSERARGIKAAQADHAVGQVDKKFEHCRDATTASGDR
jgi:hypothetical protein